MLRVGMANAINNGRKQRSVKAEPGKKGYLRYEEAVPIQEKNCISD
jgi:hypothetical protein